MAQPIKLRFWLGGFGGLQALRQDCIALCVTHFRDRDGIAFLCSITCIFDEETKSQIPRTA